MNKSTKKAFVSHCLTDPEKVAEFLEKIKALAQGAPDKISGLDYELLISRVLIAGFEKSKQDYEIFAKFDLSPVLELKKLAKEMPKIAGVLKSLDLPREAFSGEKFCLTIHFDEQKETSSVIILIGTVIDK